MSTNNILSSMLRLKTRERSRLATRAYLSSSESDSDSVVVPLPVEIKATNTYQLYPTRTFPVATVKTIIENVLTERFSTVPNNDISNQLTADVANEIKERVKALKIARYKIVSVVLISRHQEERNFSINFGTRCLWNAASDSYAEATLSLPRLRVAGIVYGVYLD